MGRKKTVRWLVAILVVLIVTAIFAGRPTYLWLNAWFHDKPSPEELPPKTTLAV